MDLDFIELLKKGQFDRQKPFIVGVSGGADSMFLLDQMVTANLQCIAAHFNHQIRSDAGKDAVFVEQAALAYEIPFHLGTDDVLSYAKRENLSVEEAARKCRYQFLFNLAESYQAQAVVVAHHANDQAETILMHFIRGTGLDGLKGMLSSTIIPEFHAVIPIFRPLLGVWQDEIKHYCEINQIPFVVDSTNQDITYTRNKLRLTIIPQFEQEFSGFQQRLLQTAKVLQGDLDIVQYEVKQIWDEVCIAQSTDFICLNKSLFMQYGIGLQRRIIRNSLLLLQSNLRDISFSIIENAITYLINHTSGQIDLVNQYVLIVHDTDFYIVKNNSRWYKDIFPNMKPQDCIQIIEPGIFQLTDVWQICVSEQSSELTNLNLSDQNIAFFDSGKVSRFPWMLRRWQPGDRFRPFGMTHGKMKLSDLFVNEKIVKPARKSWPVLVDQSGEILWVVGIRSDDRFRIDSTSQSVYKVRLKKTN